MENHGYQPPPSDADFVRWIQQRAKQNGDLVGARRLLERRLAAAPRVVAWGLAQLEEVSR